jgi:dTDP-4-amino-4,6-dideoxygalactose transaminase
VNPERQRGTVPIRREAPLPVPFHRPDIGEEEIAAVVDTLRSGWLTVGPKTHEFERAFAEAIGARQAIAVNSCTAALHLALDALELSRDAEVITPTLTFTSTASTILHAGARPVLADVTSDTLNLDPSDVERRITPRTRAIVAVHFAGHPAAMDELARLAHRYNLRLIEDAAHALPASHRGRKIGTIGDVTAFSFYATKNLTTGEGGMLTTADAALAERMRMRSLHGMSRDSWRRYNGGPWRYDISYPGFKYNMTDVAAAIGLVQLRRLPALHRRRQQIAALYTVLLSDVPELRLPVTLPSVDHAWHLYVIRLRPERVRVTRDALIERLKAEGIGTSVHFIPLHLHSYYRTALGVSPEDFPVASEAAETMLSLPLHSRMSDDDVHTVAATVRKIVQAH